MTTCSACGEPAKLTPREVFVLVGGELVPARVCAACEARAIRIVAVSTSRETGAILVPTRTVVEDLMANIAMVPDYAVTKIELVADIHAQAVTRAYEHGVTIAMGTDILLTGPDLPNTWGTNGAEPGHLVKLGLSPLEAIEAATATAPLTLGPQAPRSGQLAEGYDADVITLDADPVADIGVLADPDRITAVWTRGRKVKGAAA